MAGRAIPRTRSRPGAAVIVCAAAALTAGCFDTVSLGEGPPETQEDTVTPIPFHPWIEGAGEPDPIPGQGFCTPGLHTDLDGDGWTPAQGDCNDCDPTVGPDAVEMPTEGSADPVDENCNGQIDELVPVCDDGLKEDDQSPYSAARALDLCQTAHDGKWGIVGAAWVLPDGSAPPATQKYDLGHGILSSFGPNMPVRGGSRLLALSTGVARLPGDPEFADLRGYDKGYTCKPPEGVPEDTAACPGVESGDPHDAVALELSIKAPQNAESFAFDFDFYTYEFPQNLCSRHNDLFAALLAAGGQPDTNIALDAGGNPISVNTTTFQACQCTSGPPCIFKGEEFACPLGQKPLQGTGFGFDLTKDFDHGATGWLTAESPVEPGTTFRLRLTIQDSEDGSLDSTVLLDHFRWRRYPTQIPRTYHPDH